MSTPSSPRVLATRCLACGTAFRVVQDQLRVSEGWVRCGRCGEVFNGLSRLFDLEEARRTRDEGLAHQEGSAGGDTPHPVSPLSWQDLANLPVDDNTDLRLIDPDYAKAQAEAQRAGRASGLIETEGAGPDPQWPSRTPEGARAATPNNEPSRTDRLPPGWERALEVPPAVGPAGFKDPFPLFPSTPAPARGASSLDFVLPDVGAPPSPPPITTEWPVPQPEPLPQPEPEPAPVPDAPPPPAKPTTVPVPVEAAQDDVANTEPGGNETSGDSLPVLEDGISRFPRWVFPDESEATGDSSLSQVPPSSDGGWADPQSPAFARPARRGDARSRLRHGIALALLSVLFVTQALFLWRDALAADHPALRGLLETGCHWMGCKVSPPRRLADIVVETSSLSRSGAAGSGQYRLSFTLRNRSGIDLQVPAIDLTLTDPAGSLITRRILSGSELHLAPDAILEAGREQNLHAVLSTPGHTVSGYTLDVFYP